MSDLTPGEVLGNILEGAEKEGVGRIPSDWEVKVWLQERRARKPAHPAYRYGNPPDLTALTDQYLMLAAEVKMLQDCNNRLTIRVGRLEQPYVKLWYKAGPFRRFRTWLGCWILGTELRDWGT